MSKVGARSESFEMGKRSAMKVVSDALVDSSSPSAVK